MPRPANSKKYPQTELAKFTLPKLFTCRMLDMYGNVISGKMICRIVLIPLIIAFNVSDFFITRYFHSPCFFFTHASQKKYEYMVLSQ